MSKAAAKHTNRLIDATSPYLLQHAHNPVDWFPWGEEALAKARAEGKPILLSIGYSACHWCHVMERESFENEAIAALMNRSFVSIKVDREERPDLDDVYMAATLAMNHGQGGWPMTVFLTPDQEPFFAGTYFPPEDRWGRPGFSSLLERIAERWESDPGAMKEQAAELVAYLRENAQAAPGGEVGEDALRGAFDQLARDFDERDGGFGPAPKFPPSAGLSLLLRWHRRTGDAHALDMVRKTLDAMARGGMYDQVGGGFARYSTDAQWLVPHFEKMLYDNAQLARVYLEGFQATGDAFYRRIATETLDYVLREMTDAAGGFYSATDADSEGEEGKFFVWTPTEVAEAVGLGNDALARRFCAFYDVTQAGNWEGKSIPNTPRALADVARELGVEAAELERSLAEARARIYEARQRRVPPGLDDKVLTAWNGLMISALADGARVLGDDRYLRAARRAADFLLATLRRDGRLLRTWRAGRAHLDAYLEDYAFLAEALVDLYEAGGAALYLDEAEALVARMREDFAAEEGGFFSTARGHEALIVRPREGHDGAIPSANAAAAMALARLAHHLDRPELREDAVRAVRAWGKPIGRQPRSFARSLAVVDFLLEGPVELAFVGKAGEAGFEALWREAAGRYLPNRVVAHHDPAAGEARLPLLRGKTLVDGRAALYVCRDYACQRPVTEAAHGVIEEALSSSRAAAAGGTSAPASLNAPRVPGAATADATSAYARRQRADGSGYAPLGRTGLTCSRVGFGGYRVDDETPEHREALRQALLSGCNIVDTSTNYTDGGSERLIGEVTADLVRQGRLRREEVVLVSKIGYVQGANMELARRREDEGRPFPEMVKYGEGVWHCMHPEFLADQLPRSLGRLQVETLDVCLLHNPEYYLSDSHERSDGKLDRRREEFYRRLQAAFAWLEGEVAAGRLRAYGVSSNTCTRPADDPEFTSLTRMLAAAEAAGGAGHHFAVLQLPMNLIESGAALEKNNGPGLDRTVLEAAAERGVAVLVNRPLNAIAGEGMLRLASVSPGAQEVERETQLAVVAALEAEFRRDVASRLQTGEGSVPAENLFRWAADLAGASAHVRGLDHWQALESQRILPRLLQVVQVLDQSLSGTMAETWQAWRSRYLPELQKLLGELRREAALRSQESIAGITTAVDPRLPAERRSESLSRKALWVAASTPGVTCVLDGMRKPDYVDDAMGILAWPPLPDPIALYDAARGLVF